VNFYDVALCFAIFEMPMPCISMQYLSRLRAPDLGRNDLGFQPLGPIIGAFETDRTRSA